MVRYLERETHEPRPEDSSLEINMKRTLILTGILGLILTQSAPVEAHGKGGHGSPPSNRYRPPATNKQPLVFQNHQQPKFIAPKFTPKQFSSMAGNKLVNTNSLVRKNSKFIDGKYASYKWCHPRCSWYGSHCRWPRWCDFSNSGFSWLDEDDTPSVIMPDPIPDDDDADDGPDAAPMKAATPKQAGTPPTPDSTEAQPNVQAAVQYERFLKVKNDTKEKVRFFVLYHTQVGDGKSTWVPAEPGEPAKVYSVEVAPGQSFDLVDDENRPISADRVRIWAASPTRQWLDNQDADLWLVQPPLRGGAKADARIHGDGLSARRSRARPAHLDAGGPILFCFVSRRRCSRCIVAGKTGTRP
jgi:hypothetical protein